MTQLFDYEALWEYQSAANSVPADPAAVAVPAAGWTSPAPAPFGAIGTYITDRAINTAWAVNTGLWIRRNVVLDGLSPVHLSGRIENACYIFFDGAYIGAVNPAGSSRTEVPEWHLTIPRDVATSGTHEIALLCLDDTPTGGNTTYIYVEAEYLPPLFPFWPRAPLREELEWLTDAIISEDGTEDRQQVRINPRQTLQMSYFIPPGYQQLAANIVYGARTRQWMVPMWPHVQPLGAVTAGLFTLTVPTSHVDLRPYSSVLLWQSPERFQVLGLDLVSSSTEIVLTQPTEAFEDAYIIPLRKGFLSRRPERRFTGAKSSFALTFQIEDNDSPAVSVPSQYLGSDIYYDVGLLTGNVLDEEIAAQFNLHDEAIGLVSYMAPWLYNRPARIHKMMGEDLEEAWDIREWLFRRAGRYRAFWQPTFENDLRVTSTGSLTTTLSVSSDEYLRHASDRSHIAVETAAGWLPRAITAAVQVSNEVVQLTLSSSLAIDAEDIIRVSFLGLHRLDTDRAEIEWIGGQVCSVSVNTVEVQP